MPSYNIEIPDHLVDLSEWEPIAFREPNDGEYYADFNTVRLYYSTIGSVTVRVPRLIVRKKWKWPSWLNCESIERYSDNKWIAYKDSRAVCFVSFLEDEPPVDSLETEHQNTNLQK